MFSVFVCVGGVIYNNLYSIYNLYSHRVGKLSGTWAVIVILYCHGFDSRWFVAHAAWLFIQVHDMRWIIKTYLFIKHLSLNYSVYYMKIFCICFHVVLTWKKIFGNWSSSGTFETGWNQSQFYWSVKGLCDDVCLGCGLWALVLRLFWLASDSDWLFTCPTNLQLSQTYVG